MEGSSNVTTITEVKVKTIVKEFSMWATKILLPSDDIMDKTDKELGQIQLKAYPATINGVKEEIIYLHLSQCLNRIIDSSSPTETIRCSKYCNLVHPYCFGCTEEVYKVKLTQFDKKSPIKLFARDGKEGGKGLVFKEDDKICPLLGEILTTTLCQVRYSSFRDTKMNLKFPHLFPMCSNDWDDTDTMTYVDCLRYRGPAFYSNYPSIMKMEDKEFTSKPPNCSLRVFDDEIWLTAKRDIYGQDELVRSHELDSDEPNFLVILADQRVSHDLESSKRL
jgi:hypothetical protein